MPETETDSDLYAMTWEEAAEAVATSDLAVLPTGSIEQHSTHLPTSTDTLRADYLSAELVEAAPDHGLELLRLPTLPFGYSEHHMRFPGTITLSRETYVDAVVEIGESMAAHGVDRLLFLNTHGGNKEPLAMAADRLGRETALTVHFVHWTDFAREDLEEAFGEGWGHAGDHETSFVELYRPDLVRESKKEPQKARELPETRSYEYFDEVTELGGLGDPTNSDTDVMERVVGDTTAKILEAVAEDIEAGW
ncbi:creatininase family protein [Haloparvum sedimenti]|uniref:creatininase family protein n=1 Tax=Haloparvum sedimenti TaxID=1678448 RepID=UPI00071E867F|nr:creatininase family protein [Haloparvum sedimenti]